MTQDEGGVAQCDFIILSLKLLGVTSLFLNVCFDEKNCRILYKHKVFFFFSSEVILIVYMKFQTSTRQLVFCPIRKDYDTLPCC